MVGLALAVAGLGCATPAADRRDAEITYHEWSYSVDRPEFELTIHADGIVRLRCLERCAASGDVIERVTEARAGAVFEALRTHGFFSQPRRTGDANLFITHFSGTVTYRDHTTIHEVTEARSRLPGVVAAIRGIIDLDRWLTPSVDLYQRRLALGRWTIHDVDASGTTALETATWHCNESAVAFLLDRGATVSPVARSASSRCAGDGIGARYLSTEALDPKSVAARSWLVDSVDGRNLAMVRRLLDRGVDPNELDEQQGTRLLTAAVRSESWEMIDLLLSRGANPNAVDRQGRTVLWLAAESYNTAGIALLARYGAKVNDRDTSGRTALMHAAEHCRFWNVDALLKVGADPTLTDGRGRRTADFGLNPRDGDYAKCAESEAVLTGTARSASSAGPAGSR